MSGKLALTSPVDIFTESNNGDTFNWSHTPVYLITYRRRDKVGKESVMLLHLNNSTQTPPSVNTITILEVFFKRLFIYPSVCFQTLSLELERKNY